MPSRPRVDLDGERELLAHRQRTQRLADLRDELADVDGLGPDVEHPRLDLGEVQHVVDQPAQVMRAREDVAEVLAMALGDDADAAVVHELGEADDPVQRRAQLVRHRREEVGLRAVGALDLGVA